jgi:hypothetical protein
MRIYIIHLGAALNIPKDVFLVLGLSCIALSMVLFALAIHGKLRTRK